MIRTAAGRADLDHNAGYRLQPLRPLVLERPLTFGHRTVGLVA